MRSVALSTRDTLSLVVLWRETPECIATADDVSLCAGTPGGQPLEQEHAKSPDLGKAAHRLSPVRSLSILLNNPHFDCDRS